VLSGPGWEVSVSFAEVRPFLAHLREVRLGRRTDAIFSRLTVKELEGVIVALETRLELEVN